MRKKWILIVGILLLVAAGYLVGTGFLKQGSVFVEDYSLSADGSEMTLRIGVSDSVGFVRNVAVHQQFGGKLYLDCYAAFGGFNGSWGARNTYTVHLEPDTVIIAFYRAPDCYQVLLERDANGQWNRVN